MSNRAIRTWKCIEAWYGKYYESLYNEGDTNMSKQYELSILRQALTDIKLRVGEMEEWLNESNEKGKDKCEIKVGDEVSLFDGSWSISMNHSIDHSFPCASGVRNGHIVDIGDYPAWDYEVNKPIHCKGKSNNVLIKSGSELIFTNTRFLRRAGK